MANKRDVEAFKNELKNLPYYRQKLREIYDNLDTLEYEMANVKGVDYSKQMGNPNEYATQLKILSMIEKHEELEQKKNTYLLKVREINDVLKRMEDEDRELVVDVVAHGRKYRDVCEKLGISTSVLHYRINEIIEEAL